MSCVGSSVPLVSWLLVSCELLVYIVYNGIEYDRVLPRLWLLLFPLFNLERTSARNTRSPRKPNKCKTSMFSFPEYTPLSALCLSPLLRLKISWATSELLPSERKRKEITHYTQLSRSFLIHFVYESSECDSSLMVTRDWHLSKLGFLFWSCSLDICKQYFLWACKQSCFCLVGLYWKSPFARKCHESSS